MKCAATDPLNNSGEPQGLLEQYVQQAKYTERKKVKTKM